VYIIRCKERGEENRSHDCNGEVEREGERRAASVLNTTPTTPSVTATPSHRAAPRHITNT